MGLFKEENYKVIIDPEIKIIPEFKALITRDKDRRKRNAFNELAYVYFMVDYRSPYNAYPSEERSVRIIKDLKLPENFKPDAKVKAAMKRYEELQETPAIKSLGSIREALYVSLNAVNYVKGKISDFLNARIENEDEDLDPSVLEPAATELIQFVNMLLKLAGNIPSAIATLNNVEEQVKKEQSDKRRIKGGGSANYFED